MTTVNNEKPNPAGVITKESDGTRTRKDRPTGSMHVGDIDFDANDPAFGADATWNEVFTTCCCHTPEEWGMIFIGICIVVFFLYFFLVGLELLGSGAKVMGGCAAGSLFGDETNPVAGLMVGILATVLLQSSSTTTSIIVSLVGAESVSVQQGIYMVMGANIGTSVTNTLVALGQMGDGDQLERAFAGATVHDMFNFMTVAVFFPIEIITGYLFYLTSACVRNFETQDGEDWEGPVKKVVAPLADMIIKSNKKVVEAVADGGSCAEFYPIVCDNPDEPTYSTCTRGLIDCNKNNDKCPTFFQATATQGDDQLSGFCAFLLGLIILFFCLFGMVKVLQKMLLGMSTRIIYKSTNINGYLAMLIGCALTILVQSSSITTSTFTPLVGLGVIRLEQMYPLTLGANIGTTITALLAALLSTTEALQVALSHLFFNVSGIIVYYPIPLLRKVPLHAARQLGRATRIWRGFPIMYIIVMFFLLELLLLGLSALFTNGAIGLTVLGSMLTIVLFFLLLWAVYWWRWQGGKDSCYNCMVQRQKRHEVNKNLPEDMEYLKNKIIELQEHTGLIDDDVDANDVDEKFKPDIEDGSEENTADTA
ncbi:sodium dependent phosphate transporter [Nitzschia inconspicua]|uniref:Sodium dependent phosphate transporter n=2 Tax=Nitzschia inconspicua TaxID=303405 RepID=A0A9K3M4L2_9STRA|nr:sodium dependent phosphate transporter [Nitzschia inconspicua]